MIGSAYTGRAGEAWDKMLRHCYSTGRYKWGVSGPNNTNTFRSVTAAKCAGPESLALAYWGIQRHQLIKRKETGWVDTSFITDHIRYLLHIFFSAGEPVMIRMILKTAFSNCLPVPPKFSCIAVAAAYRMRLHSATLLLHYSRQDTAVLSYSWQFQSMMLLWLLLPVAPPGCTGTVAYALVKRPSAFIHQWNEIHRYMNMWVVANFFCWPGYHDRALHHGGW